MKTLLPLQKLATEIETELSKKVTDRQTWKLVAKFWTLTCDLDAWWFDRIELLEARMQREHGWAR